jgi:hypothetical protein
MRPACWKELLYFLPALSFNKKRSKIIMASYQEAIIIYGQSNEIISA